MNETQIDELVAVVRSGLVNIIEAADPRKLIRIARLIDSMESEAADDRLPGLMTLLQSEAARRAG